MHIEFLVEDRSGASLLEIIVPKILGGFGQPHTWRIKGYKGVGKLPPGLKPNTDPAKRILLDNLPRLISAYARTPGIDGIVVVLDADRRDCRSFLAELTSATARCPPGPAILFRLAIEEIEAWYLGDRQALLKAYPRAKPAVVGRYDQDSVCDTWELLADAVHPGGSAALKRAGGPMAGRVKYQWAQAIGPEMDPGSNASPSFGKFRDGLNRLAMSVPADAE